MMAAAFGASAASAAAASSAPTAPFVPLLDPVASAPLTEAVAATASPAIAAVATLPMVSHGGSSVFAPVPASAAASAGALAGASHWTDFLPHTWQPNLIMLFGVMLVLGTVGAMLASRLRWLPTITGFMAVGLAAGPSGLGVLSPGALAQARVLVDIALGLIMFSLGATLHPVQALRNRSLVLTSLVETVTTFVVITGLLMLIGSPMIVAVLAGAIAVSSSPAVLVHVSHELEAEGPTLDAAEALVAANNVIAFVLFSLALPVAMTGQAFDPTRAIAEPAWRLVGAVVVAVLVAWVTVRIAGWTRRGHGHESQLHFALVVGAVMLVLGLSSALHVSALFAGLALGIACRWFDADERLVGVSFGGGGNLFFTVLFVYAGANLHLRDVWLYAPVALTFFVARALIKVGAVTLCGIGLGYRTKGSFAAGLLLVPMAGLAIGLVETANGLVPELGGRIAAIVLAAVALCETFGPPIAAYAIRMSGEAGRARRETALRRAAARASGAAPAEHGAAASP